MEYNSTIDVGVQKRIGRLRLRLDVFNVLDISNNTREAELAGPAFNLRIPLETQAPRVLRVGLACDF